LKAVAASLKIQVCEVHQICEMLDAATSFEQVAVCITSKIGVSTNAIIDGKMVVPT
jgi:hypothetical protein